MKATMLLADAAQAVGGKLYILGGGWSVTGPGPVSFAVAIKLDVPWDVADFEHVFRLELLDADGARVRFAMPQGEQDLLCLDGAFNSGRPDELKPGTAVDGAIALNFGGCPIPSGGRYELRLWIDGETRDDWRIPFSTRPDSEEGEKAA